MQPRAARPDLRLCLDSEQLEYLQLDEVGLVHAYGVALGLSHDEAWHATHEVDEIEDAASAACDPRFAPEPGQ